ncbi:MAG: ADP-glyceromanno-heptose 6-epimerase [Gammaproteobacteria bacterium]
MIVVTGGAGFIGSNLVATLNRRGRDDILLVEDLSDGHKAINLADSVIADYLDWRQCLELLEGGGGLPGAIERIYHLGACSDTTEWNGKLMMETNFRFSRALFEYATARGIPLVYASSAAVYGIGTAFAEVRANERPLNMYGYSKLVFDQYVRSRLAQVGSTVVGLRYFNVYGPREQHKGRMASVVWHFQRQLRDQGRVRLFGASHGCAAGEQRRDFVYVDDVIDVTLHCGELGSVASGIYNCGTGRAETFNEVARSVIAESGHGEIEYIDFPADLLPAYQAYTEANLDALRATGYTGQFRDVAAGVREYLSWLGS